MSAPPTDSAGTDGVSYRFSFVPRYGAALYLPLVLGCGLGLGLLFWTLHDAAAHVIAAALGLALLMLVVWTVGRVFALRRYATSLGHIELDDDGARWRRLDGSLGFDVPWEQVEHARVDRRRRLVELVRDHGQPVTLGALDDGRAPLRAALERFAELTELLARGLPLSEYQGTSDRGGAFAMFSGGAFVTALAVSLHFLNRLFAARLGLRFENFYVPFIMGLIGALIMFLAWRRHNGSSPPDRSGPRSINLPKLFAALGVMVVANFVLQILTNLRHGGF